jgi:MFS transporter, DHA1 family, tetracycline resistance protein
VQATTVSHGLAGVEPEDALPYCRHALILGRLLPSRDSPVPEREVDSPDRPQPPECAITRTVWGTPGASFVHGRACQRPAHRSARHAADLAGGLRVVQRVAQRGTNMSQADIGAESERSFLLTLPPGAPAAPAPAPPALQRLLVAVALFVTGLAMTVPARPALILDAVGGSTRDASYVTGVVDAMTAGVEIFGNPVLGAVSDVVGRRPVLLLSQVGELAALLIIARFHQFVAGYFVAYLLIGLTGVFFMTVSSVLGDISVATPEDAGAGARNYGALGATIGGCFLVGPGLGGLIEDRLYQTASFHAAAVLVVLSMGWMFFFVPETRTAPGSVLEGETGGTAEGDWARMVGAVRRAKLNPLPKIRDIFSNGALQWLAAGIALSSLAQGGLNSIFFLYLNTRLGWRSAETGYFLSAVGLSLLVSQGYLVRAFVARFGENTTIVIGYSFGVLHYIVYAYVRSSWIAYFGLLLGCISFVAEPAMKGLLCRQVPPSKQGALQGALSGLTTLLRPFSPLLATTIFGYSTSLGNPGLVFFVIASLSAASLCVICIGLRKPGLK